ncbi:hypothetical protein [uncultured Bacteroides sp.]|uniref:hypothetical protein n=1 Tax=uncultured Bacteroides sp. TaxID=162156 RepID=UPI002AAACE9B|nr:hypothetical protein [uncultured Bacteroides sp.]
MKKKKSNSLMDYVKAARRGSREAEIEQHGHPINYRKVIPSKKAYNRKKNKADDKGLPYLFLQISKVSVSSSFLLHFSWQKADYMPH